jgi:hypothetical protein
MFARRLLQTAAVTLALAVPSLTWSQPVAPQPSTPTQTFSDQELMTFARATLDVEQIAMKYEEKMQAVEDDAQKDDFADQATGEMAEAVQQRGLSVEKYNEMAETVTRNPELAQRVIGYRNEAK